VIVIHVEPSHERERLLAYLRDRGWLPTSDERLHDIERKLNHLTQILLEKIMPLIDDIKAAQDDVDAKLDLVGQAVTADAAELVKLATAVAAISTSTVTDAQLTDIKTRTQAAAQRLQAIADAINTADATADAAAFPGATGATAAAGA
jgi:hypothetical protein